MMGGYKSIPEAALDRVEIVRRMLEDARAFARDNRPGSTVEYQRRAIAEVWKLLLLLSLPPMVPSKYSVAELEERDHPVGNLRSFDLTMMIFSELHESNRDRAVRALKQHYDRAIEREFGEGGTPWKQTANQAEDPAMLAIQSGPPPSRRRSTRSGTRKRG
jgi:hypothetical protein